MNHNTTQSALKKHEPLFHIIKRGNITKKTEWITRALAILGALVVCGILAVILIGANPIAVYQSMFMGCFGSELRIWKMLQSIAILLCISLAVTPAFKMQFWNIGAEGQVLIGGLATAAVMFYLKDTAIPTPLFILLMIVCSIVAASVWAIIPAIFKAKWNTNETLFTLMMNYVAIQLVNFFINTWVKSGSGKLAPMYGYGLPVIGDQPYILNIIVVAVLTVACYIYLHYTKHGYEISVVGQSQNTARYIGIDVKKVIIRTLALSGALCGVAGLLLVGGTNYTISASTAGGRGFTAIMVSWLAKFNPLLMVVSSLLIVFMQQGASQVSSDFMISDAFSDIVTGIILFFIIGCEFFINYQIVFRHKNKEVG